MNNNFKPRKEKRTVSNSSKPRRKEHGKQQIKTRKIEKKEKNMMNNNKG